MVEWAVRDEILAENGVSEDQNEEKHGEETDDPTLPEPALPPMGSPGILVPAGKREELPVELNLRVRIGRAPPPVVPRDTLKKEKGCTAGVNPYIY